MKHVLVTGATGFVGSNLVPLLLEKGHFVHAASRDLARLRAQPWASHPHVALVAMDAQERASIVAAMRGCSCAYYLLHSMETGVDDFCATDRLLARNFRDAAAEANVRHIIYLGGLGRSSPLLSDHLRSRHEVGQELKAGKVPVTHLRAAMIIGRGSASYEILHRIADAVPVIFLPSWSSTRTQPIALLDALRSLCACADAPGMRGKTFDIGGPVRLSYRELLELYIDEKGLRRVIIPIPSPPTAVSAWLVRLLVPLPLELLRPLLAGVRHRTVCNGPRMRSPSAQRLLSPREALRAAIGDPSANYKKSPSLSPLP